VRRTADGAEHELPKVGAVELVPGETVVSVTNGGGGYGPPSERDPERVRRDVEAGYVSAGRAAEVYGVAVLRQADGRCAVNAEATARLRQGDSGGAA
jgi:N-methylhydantoinase B